MPNGTKLYFENQDINSIIDKLKFFTFNFFCYFFILNFFFSFLFIRPYNSCNFRVSKWSLYKIPNLIFGNFTSVGKWMIKNFWEKYRYLHLFIIFFLFFLLILLSNIFFSSKKFLNSFSFLIISKYMV